MSAARSATKAPRFTTYTDVEVDIEPTDLEAAGWIYVGKEAGPTTERTVEVVMRWHDETHDCPWRWCRQEPCASLNREPASAGR